MKKLITVITLVFVFALSACTKTPEVPENPIETVRANLSIASTVETIQLPTEIDGVTITWSSNKANTLTEDYETIQSDEDVTIFLTALLSYENRTMTKNFDVTIKQIVIVLTDEQIIDNFILDITLPEEVDGDITLPQGDTVFVSWESSDQTYITNTGEVTRPTSEVGGKVIALTATFTLNDISKTKTYNVFVLADNTYLYTGYYEGASDLAGLELKTFLHNLIDDHTELSYDDLRQALQVTDEDPNNPDNIILLYTGNSIPSTWDSGATWNREHVWPRSLGDMDRGDAEHNDLHHVRPSNPTVNSHRGNLNFDNGGSLVSGTDDCYKDSNSFEPRDEVKGDVARMIFYMAVRYEGDSGEIDLEISSSTSTTYPTIGVLETLIEWHLNDLPDDYEMNRNDLIFSYQGNRNPFIDHPEFVELIWD